MLLLHVGEPSAPYAHIQGSIHPRSLAVGRYLRHPFSDILRSTNPSLLAVMLPVGI